MKKGSRCDNMMYSLSLKLSTFIIKRIGKNLRYRKAFLIPCKLDRYVAKVQNEMEDLQLFLEASPDSRWTDSFSTRFLRDSSPEPICDHL